MTTPDHPHAAAGAIRASGVTRSYGHSSAPVHALRGLSLSIESGERLALLGKSGSGKSTLLNLLGGLDRPTAGTIAVGGRNIAELNSEELADYRLSTVGMIFQAHNLILSRTALENVELPMLFAGVPPAERRAAATRALEAVGLAGRVHHRPTELSGGEQQRVSLARAIVNAPAILLADEPTGNLDSATAESVMDVIHEHIRAHRTTFVLVTHDEDIARRRTDRIVRLSDGQLVS